jgi:hypothetical protein
MEMNFRGEVLRYRIEHVFRYSDPDEIARLKRPIAGDTEARTEPVGDAA